MGKSVWKSVLEDQEARGQQSCDCGLRCAPLLGKTDAGGHGSSVQWNVSDDCQHPPFAWMGLVRFRHGMGTTVCLRSGTDIILRVGS